MATNILQFGDLKYKETQELDRNKTLFILSASALELHGFHLPHNTDQIGAQLMGNLAARAFSEAYPEWTVVLFPHLSIGSDTIPYQGSIETSMSTVYKVIYSYAKALSKDGFKNFVVVNGHGGFKHNLAIDDACRKAIKSLNMVMCSPSIKLMEEYVYGHKHKEIEAALGRDFYPEESKGLIAVEHAAGWETSIMLATHPELVADNFKEYPPLYVELNSLEKSLASIFQKLADKIPTIKTILEEHRIDMEGFFITLKSARYLYDKSKPEWTYNGTPGIASKEIGAAWIKCFQKDLLSSLTAVYIEKSKKPEEMLSPYSPILLMQRRFYMTALWLIIAVILLVLIVVI